VNPFRAIITIIVLAIVLQTAYGPQYCRSEPRAGTLALLNVDRSLTRDYCNVSQVRDRNAPLSQWIDALNYDLVALGNLLGFLFNQIRVSQQAYK
jgi:hypothetical protein